MINVHRHRRTCALILITALAHAPRLSAQSPIARAPVPAPDSTDFINADRPGIADGSRVIQPRQLQLEIGLQQEFRRTDGGARTTTTFVPLLIRLGISEQVEARVETNSLTSQRMNGSDSPATRATGYSPVSIGAKYQIYDSGGDNRRSFGLIARVFPPTGSGDFHNDRYTGDVRLAADWDFAPKLSLNPNVGVARQQDGSGHSFTAALYAVTLTYSPSEKINPFIDMGAQAPEAPAGATSIIFDAGLAYIIGRDLQLDLSAGRGTHGATPPRPFVAIGISFR